MNTLKSVLEKRAKLWDEMQELRSNAKGGQFTPGQKNLWDKLEGQVADLSQEIEGIQAHDSELIRALEAGEIGGEFVHGDGSGRTSRKEAANDAVLTRSQRFTDAVERRGLVREEERDLDFGRYISGIVTGNWQGADPERRAMSEGVLGSGGYAVPTLMSAQLIDLARNKAAVFQAGAHTVPMQSSTVNLARWSGDPTPQWRAENAAITTSDAALTQVQLVAKSLAVITQVSRELVEDAVLGGGSNSDVGSQIKFAFGKSFGLALDAAALSGAGTSTVPRGVLNTSGINTTSMGANGAAPTNYDFLVTAVGTLQDNNEDPNGIIYAPRTDRELATLKDTTGQYLRPPTILEDIPRYATNQEPVNRTQGTSVDASNVYVGDWTQLFIGMRTNLEISVLDQRYADNGQIAFLGWLRADVAVARPKAFCVVQGVR